LDEKAITDFEFINDYPFDTTIAKVRIELTHFETEDTQSGHKMSYRFDCYYAEDWVSWKPEANGFPDF